MDSGDCFWEESDVKGYNFNDDESAATQMCGVSIGGTARLSQQIKAGLGAVQLDFNISDVHDNVTSQPELQELISEKALEAILAGDNVTLPFSTGTYQSDKEELRILRRQVQSRWSPPEIDNLLKRILTGQPYSLELYHSLNSKKELLKSAVALGDGDAILMVVLFLSRTLKKSLFHQILSTSPVAVQHYACYLSTRMQIQEVTDLLEMVGKSREASMKHFEFACSNPQRQLQRLRACSRNHFNDMKEKQIVDSFIRLLEWEGSVNLPLGEPVSVCLEHACKLHWDSKGPSSPFSLVEDQAVSERLFQWITLNVKAAARLWPDIDSLFITKGWLGNKRVKTELPMDEVVMKLHELDAPQAVLLVYLDLIDNVEKKLEVAKRVHCHRVVIDVYMSQRDRLSILKYRANLEPQSEDFIFAEQALKTPTIKWKN